MGGGRSGAGGAEGQASVEWMAIVLVAALSLGGSGALLAARAGSAPAGERGLGELAAKRLVCAAEESCADGLRAQGPALGGGDGLGAQRPTLGGGVRPPARARLPGARVRGGLTRARAVDALRRLRSLGARLVRRAWVVCIGYRRFRYELEHPRLPTEPMPVEEAVDIANGCLNPYAFLVEDE